MPGLKSAQITLCTCILLLGILKPGISSDGFKAFAVEMRVGNSSGQAGRLDTPTAPVLPEQIYFCRCPHSPCGPPATKPSCLHGFSHLHLDLAPLYGIEDHRPCLCLPVARVGWLLYLFRCCSTSRRARGRKKENTFTQLKDDKNMGYYQSALSASRRNYIIATYKYAAFNKRCCYGFRI